MSLADKYGPWALIAGASEGIGEAFALQLASQGINLVLLSRSAEKLDVLQCRLASSSDVQTRVIAADLCDDQLMSVVAPACEDIEVGMLVYNAGAVHGADLFLDDPLEKALGLVALNCRGPVLLAHHFGQGMRESGCGGMIFLSSMAALAGGSYIATYAATKSFDIIFAQSLWHEMAGFGVDVLGLIAGATKTPAMAASGLDFEAGNSEFQPMESDDVAREGLEQLGKGPIWVAGAANRAGAEIFNSLSRRELLEAMSQSTASMYDKPYKSVPDNG